MFMSGYFGLTVYPEFDPWKIEFVLQRNLVWDVPMTLFNWYHIATTSTNWTKSFYAQGTLVGQANQGWSFPASSTLVISPNIQMQIGRTRFLDGIVEASIVASMFENAYEPVLPAYFDISFAADDLTRYDKEIGAGF